MKINLIHKNMKNSIKFLLIAFLGFCIYLGALGDWPATVNVHVTEGDDDCDYPSYVGKVKCQIVPNGDKDDQTWQGYHTYVFYLDAPSSGSVWAMADLDDGNDPPQSFCDDVGYDYWTVPYTSLNISLVPEEY